jgi:hypothetical protein
MISMLKKVHKSHLNKKLTIFFKNSFIVIRKYIDDRLLGFTSKNRPNFMDMIANIELKL